MKTQQFLDTLWLYFVGLAAKKKNKKKTIENKMKKEIQVVSH